MAYKMKKFGGSKDSPVKQGFLSPAFYGGGAMGAADFLMGPTAALGAAGIAAYESGQKHSKGKAVKGQANFMADAKKKQKSIMKEGKKKKSIFKK